MALPVMKNFIHDDQPQSIYDSFNDFIFSSDRKVMGKLISKASLVGDTLKIPGHIVELGVFKGSGVMAWLKTLDALGAQHKNVLGFDFFSAEEAVESIKTTDKGTMDSLFADRGFDPRGYEVDLSKILDDAGFTNFDLIKGDVTETLPRYLESRPGFRASIVNFDLDVEYPTKVCMDALWDHLVPGGYFVFDEYGFEEWTESNAVDQFLSERTETLELMTTGFYAPSAYIRKPM